MAEPSLRYVIVNLQGEMRTSRTEYLLGRNSRFESRDCRGYCDGDPTQPGAMQFQYGPLRALIQNRDLHYQFHVNGRVDVPVFADVGPRETGFPLLVTRTHRSSFNDAEGNIRMHTSTYREEVTEFSEETLGPRVRGIRISDSLILESLAVGM